jgi:hypothetical protein
MAVAAGDGAMSTRHPSATGPSPTDPDATDPGITGPSSPPANHGSGVTVAAGRIFEFEADFAGDLRCIPMAVRRKLDLVGVKLGLPHWHRLSAEERQRLLAWPDDIEGLGRLGEWLRQRTAAMPEGLAKALPPALREPWQQAESCPEALLESCRDLGLELDASGWSRLDDLQRFALMKLSRGGHEHRNLPHALAEFGLIN